MRGEERIEWNNAIFVLIGFGFTYLRGGPKRIEGSKDQAGSKKEQETNNNNNNNNTSNKNTAKNSKKKQEQEPKGQPQQQTPAGILNLRSMMTFLFELYQI